MRSVFVKIFLWFWLANVIIAGVAILAVLLTAPPRDPETERWRTVAGDMLTDFGRSAVAALDAGGAGELERFRVDWERRSGATIGIYDANGDELSGARHVPAATELFNQIERDGDVEVLRRGGVTYVATTVTDEDGTVRVVMRELDPRVRELRGPRWGARRGGRGRSLERGGLGPEPRAGSGRGRGERGERGGRGGGGVRGGRVEAPPPPIAADVEAAFQPQETIGQTDYARLFARPRLMVLTGLAVLLVSGLVCLWLAHHLARPVRTLRDVTRRLAGGDLATRTGGGFTHRRDELGGLGRDFDDMAARLESLVGAQQRLVRDVSHELRSPLTRLNIALDLARRKTGDDAHPELDRIALESERLNDLISRMLTLSRLETNSALPRLEPIDLAALVEAVTHDADFEARSRRCRVVLRENAQACVLGDPGLLRSSLENVVRNAIRFTAEDTDVELRLTASGSNAVLTVRDHGPGFSEASLPHLFDPFFRDRDAPQNAEPGGAGLGLAIAARAVRAHGGSIEAANADDGMVVKITLPVAHEP